MTTTQPSSKNINDEINALKAEVERNPTDLVAKITLASTLERTGRIQEARQYYQDVIDSDTDNIFAPSARKALEAMGIAPIISAAPAAPTDALQDKINELKAEVDKDPSDLVAQINLANALEKAGQIAAAREVYQGVQASDPEGLFGITAVKALEAMGVSIDNKVKQIELPSQKELAASETSQIQQKPLKRLLQRFYDLPISKKQLTAFVLSEAIALGLVVTGAGLMFTGLRTQLLQQSKSELTVSKINYDLKINQMGFGFRGQSENTAIIGAVRQRKTNNMVNAILRNELWTRQIEFATLVDANTRIIAHAGIGRVGAKFDPSNIVSQALDNGDQVKTSELISYDELAAESFRFAELRAIEKGTDPASQPNFLIRYTATPIIDPLNGEVLGALVSGDVAKTPIVANTNQAFEDGYTAIYLVEPDGKFSLATSQEVYLDKFLNANIPLPNTNLLTEAVKAKGETVSKWIKLSSGHTYGISAKTISNFAGKPIAVLVRGTDNDFLNNLLVRILGVQGVLIGLGLVLTIILARFLARALVEPIRNLSESTLKFAQGERDLRAEVFANDEVGDLAITFNAMADSINASEAAKEEQARKRQAEAEFQRKEKERIQQGVIKLLLEIEEAKEGNLTVQAKVEEGEMGSIADAFNSTIRSLREIVDRVKATATQVQDSAYSNETSVQKLSEEATNQVRSITETLNSVAQMGESIQSVANSAKEAADIARKALNAATTGDKIANQTVGSIDNIRASVAETSKKMKRLAESSQEISKIVGIISNISEKTNLLAFNASIEASRAGENGQGFRVVADEVRRLAERVTESAKDIEQLVSTIQSETTEVMHTMEESTTQVVRGTKLVRQTQGTLQQLAEISQKIDRLVQSISTSTISQAEYSKQVTGTMQEVVAIAENTSAESEAVSNSLQELVGVATELQQSVSRFQV
jgi:twitching motility protein PilJ